MTISWQWMVIVIVLVVACVVAAVLGEDVIAGTLGGFAGGLLTKGGAIGRKSGASTAVAAVLALVLLFGCTPAVLVADTTLAEVCDAAGDEIDAEHERGELTTDQAECAVLGLQRACLGIHDRLAESVDEEE